MAGSRRIGLYSEKQDGSDRIPLAAIGRVSGITRGTSWPGGDDALTANLEADPLLQHRALIIGRRVRACIAGQTIWYGELRDPVPGTPWQITCVGRGSMASDYQVAAQTGISTNSDVDAKIADGLPWTRTTSLPDGLQPTDFQIVNLADALIAAGVAAAQQWQVAIDGTITFAAPPTTPSYLLVATDRPPRSADNYVTVLYGTYIDSGTLALTFAVATGATVHGIREDTVDLTGFGPITAAQAVTYLTTLVGRSGFRASYAAPFTVEPGRLLLYPGGTAKDLATVRAGVMVRPTGLSPDQLGETTTGIASADFVVGLTRYDDDTGVLELTPFEDSTAQNVDLQSMVSDLVKQAA